MSNVLNRFSGMRDFATLPLFGTNEAGGASGAERQFLDHFALNEQPFGVTPDPRFLYLGPKHRQALTALTYGTDTNRGFMTLIAPPGMGKTSLLYQYLESLRDKARTVFLFQTDGDSRDLMYYLLAELGLNADGKDLPAMRILLNQFLTAELNAGTPFVLVIDEAQNLDEKMLESIRLLSDFETPWMKLMQIVLAGQPELAERLARPSMAQLRQRVSFAIRIEALTRQEVNAYVDHRLWVAGNKSNSLFSLGARTLLSDCSQGVPRNINHICFSAMSLAWAAQRNTIDREMMRDVLADMELGQHKEELESAPAKMGILREIPGAAQGMPAPVLTVKGPAARWHFAQLAIAAVTLTVLVWAGVHFRVAMGLGLLPPAPPAAVHSHTDVLPDSIDTTAPPSFDTLTAEPKEEAPASGDTANASAAGNNP